MAKVFPFQPYRYASKAGDPQNLVTQPYDKISSEMQRRYQSLSPHNLVRVILGERFPGDDDSNNVYTRAATYFNDWISQGILAQDREPGFFVYFQEFTMPDTGERLVRKGFIGLGAVEDYSARIVHRHEQTLSGPKKDRMEVLKHTGAHFGQIFMLYPDRAGEIDAILDQTAAAKPDVEVTDEYGAVHRLWKIADQARIARIQELMAGKKLLIADGHHRYETALAFRQQNPGNPAAEKVMMTFVNMYSPGLRILGTHRVIRGLEQFDPDLLLQKARQAFNIRELSSAGELKAAWAEPHDEKIRIGLAFGASPLFFVLETDRKKRLDVNVLHEDVLRDILGITEEAVREEKFLKYVRGVDPAIEFVRKGDAQLVFLLEPPSVDQVGEISFGGGVMPQKSTDFYPKLLTGLTIYKL
jgi:uncharacterized protein (DUF1015 family)